MPSVDPVTAAISACLRVCALLLVFSAAAAAAANQFEIPATSDVAAHADLAVSDDVPPGPDVIDLGLVADAAQAQADRFELTRWDLEALAEHLGDDVWAAHAVLDRRIGVDAYVGVLRGAQGTLAARAGSAWDRALLLAALLDAMGYETRYALGALDASHPAAAARGPHEPWDDPPISEVLAVDADALLRRARRDHAVVLRALEGASLGAGAVATEPHGDHVWVQVRDGDGWLDVDPAAQPGETLTPATSHLDAPPEDAVHRLIVRVGADVLESGAVERRTVLEASLAAWEAAERDLWLTFERESGSGAAGVLAGVLGVDAWTPVLLVGGEPNRGESFTLGSDASAAGGFFGASGSDDPELVTLWLELESSAPAAAQRRAERVLYDRAPAGARGAADIAVGDLVPVPDDRSPDALGTLYQVLVSTGGASPLAHAIDRMMAADLAALFLAEGDDAAAYELSDLLRPLAVANAGLVVASERLLVDGLAAPGARAFVATPRAYVVSFGPDEQLDGGTGRVIDLALDGIDVAGVDALEAARHRTWYGALQTALETEDALRAARAVDPDTLRVGSVSLALPGSALRVWVPADVGDVPGEAVELRRALEAGWMAVEVGAPTTFFAIDPVSGAMRSEMEPGIRPGYSYGGNYVNSAGGGGPRYVVDPSTGRPMGIERNGKYYPHGKPPPKKCERGGTEYTMLLNCISIPASFTAGVLIGSTIVAIVAWASVIIQVIGFVAP